MKNKIKSKSEYDCSLSLDSLISLDECHDSFKNYVDVRKHQYEDELMNYLLNSMIITTNELEHMFDVVQVDNIITNIHDEKKYYNISKSYYLRFNNHMKSLSNTVRKYIFFTLIEKLRYDEELTYIYDMKSETVFIFFIDDEIEISESELN